MADHYKKTRNIKNISDLPALCYPVIRDMLSDALRSIETNHVSTDDIASVIYESEAQYVAARNAVSAGLPVHSNKFRLLVIDEGQSAVEIGLWQEPYDGSRDGSHALWPRPNGFQLSHLPASMQTVVTEARAITTQTFRMLWLVKLLSARCTQIPHALFLWPNLRYCFPPEKTNFFEPKTPREMPIIPAEARDWIGELDLFLVRCRSWQPEAREPRYGGIRIWTVEHNDYPNNDMTLPISDEDAAGRTQYGGARYGAKNVSLASLANVTIHANTYTK